MFSLASDSVAVAPFQVSTAIEITTRIAATTATGRRVSRRSVRRSKNGSASSSTRQIVGIPTVARIDRVRPLEDPEQVEEEVEVPVGPRDERERPRVGLVVVLLAEQPRLRCRRRSRARRIASTMMTITTTRLMTVSWNIACGKNDFPRVLTSSLYFANSRRRSSSEASSPSAPFRGPGARGPARGRPLGRLVLDPRRAGGLLRPRRRGDAEADDEVQVQADQRQDRAR